MFTLTILNKIIGNVSDSRTETIDKGFKFHFRLPKNCLRWKFSLELLITCIPCIEGGLNYLPKTT